MTTFRLSILFTLSSFLVAQDQSPHGWRRVGDPPQAAATTPADEPQATAEARPDDQPSYGGIPARLTVKSGTFITVRVNQWLSSDRNQPGDAFGASLEKAIVVDGVVVAQRGQTVGGRVSEVQKAGRVQGVSRLGLQLTDLTLVDGQQVPLRSQLVVRAGPTSEGRDAGAIAGTTATGAAIGAAAGWGRGAAIGAGVGAAAGIAGVLLTRGHPIVIYPESVLTFRIEDPVAISTERAPQAFRYVEPEDYQRPDDRPYNSEARVRPPADRCAVYGCPPPAPYPYYAPYYYPYYGPGLTFFYSYGPRYYYRPRFYGGRIYRRR